MRGAGGLTLKGFYKVRFELNGAAGRSVMYMHGGRMLGGNSAFAHIGTPHMAGTNIGRRVSNQPART